MSLLGRWPITLPLVLAVLSGCGSAAAPAGSPSTAASPATAPKAAASTAPSSLVAASKTAASAAGSAAPASAAASAKPNLAPLGPAVKVRVSSMGLSGEAGTFIALDRGYFKEEGLDVEIVPGLFGTSLLGALVSGDVELGSMALDVSAINAVSRNVDERIVAPLTFTPPGDKNASILIRKDLVDSGKYKEPKDMKGMTIAAGPVANTSAQYFTEQALAKGGLKAADVQFVTMGFPDELAALANKKVDAGWEVEPLSTAAEDQGFAKEVLWSGELFPNYDPFLLVSSPKFKQAQPEALNRFVTAHLRGQRDYYAAFVKSQADASQKASIIDILTKHTTVKDAKVWNELADKGRMQSVEPNGQLHPQGFDQLQDFFIRVGTQKERIDISNVIDNGPMQYALQRLGRM
ncbi:MAG TPA: ABC transporter substrate-binding protein [Chloroflexota bacterium]